MSKLRVTRVDLKWVLGATSMSIQPGKVNTLKGSNGSGKSTLLKSIQAGIGGGDLAKIRNIHAPEDEDSEVVLVLESADGEEYRVQKTGGKTAKVLKRVGDTAAFETIPRPQDFLSSLFDSRACNPIDLITAKTDQWATLLLEALDLELDRQELNGIIGDLAEHVQDLPDGLHPLEEVALVRDAIFRARTGVNRDQKNKAGAADQTRRNAPAKVPGDVTAEIKQGEEIVARLAEVVGREDEQADAAQRQAISAAAAAYELEEQKAKAAFQSEAKKLRAAHDAKAAELRADVERQIAALKAKTDSVVDALNGSTVEQIDAAEVIKDAALEQARQAREAARFGTEAKKRDLAQAREKLAELRAVSESAIKAKALLAQAQQFEDESEALKKTAEQMTEAIEALDGFKRRLAGELPMGLEIEGKNVKVNGVPLDQINTAQRIDLAVSVAVLRAKKARLPALFVDGAEAIDDDAFQLFVERISREDVQLFCGRVEAHPLEVETVGEAVTA